MREGEEGEPRSVSDRGRGECSCVGNGLGLSVEYERK